jgi:hypothetical protein
MSQCAGSFCRNRPDRCAPFGLTPAKMLSYASLWGRWYTRTTVVQKRLGSRPGSCSTKARRIEWGRIRVQCQTIETHCTLLPVDAFGITQHRWQPCSVQFGLVR